MSSRDLGRDLGAVPRPRLASNSFKLSSETAPPPRTRGSRKTLRLSPSPASSASSSLSSSSSYSSLNKMASGAASNFQSYASRYIESIRPRSWGSKATSSNSLSNSLALPEPPPAAISRSAGSSRAESPSKSSSSETGRAMPQLLTFRTPYRLSPLPASRAASSAAAATTSALSSAAVAARPDLGWFRHITEASSAYRSRESSRRSYAAKHNGDVAGVTSAKSVADLGKTSSSVARNASFRDKKAVEEKEKAAHTWKSDYSSATLPRASSSSSSSLLAASSSSDATLPKKRLQRVEMLKFADPELIDPSAVVVTSGGSVHVADRVISPLERLRMKDAEISGALEAKRHLVAELLGVPVETVDSVDKDSIGHNPDAKEVLLAAIAQAKLLSDLVSSSLSASAEDHLMRTSRASSSSSSSQPVPPALALESAKLISISHNMNAHLTTLLSLWNERDEERDRLRRELRRSQEQMGAFLSAAAVKSNVNQINDHHG